MRIRSSVAPWRVASICIALLAACATTRQTASPEATRSEVLDAEQRWWRAVSRGDVDHALNKFSSDTTFETPDGAQLRGRVALGERLRRDGHDRIEVLGVPEHVHVDSPELVLVTGTGQWMPAASEARAPTTIRYIDTWRWTGSGWRLVSAATGTVADSSAGTALVRQVLAAWSTGDWAGLQPLLAPGYRARSAGNGGSELRKRFDTFHRNWTRARFDIEEQFAVGERIVTRIAATLTEAGTGKTLRYSGLDVSRVVDGQLTDHWDSWEEMRGQPAPPAPVDEGSGNATPAAATVTSAANDPPQAILVPAGDAAAPSSPADPGQPARIAQPAPAHSPDAAVE